MREQNLYIDNFKLVRKDVIYNADLCCCYMSEMTDHARLVRHLHPSEYKYYTKLVAKRRIKSYLLGRYVAKKAVAVFTGEQKLAAIHIQPGIFTQPVVVCSEPNVQVSISHCNDFAVAIAFPEVHPLAIDIEQIDNDKAGVLISQSSRCECERVMASAMSWESSLTLLWTAKEALSKVIKTGMMTPFALFEISKVKHHHDDFIECHYKNFGQYKSLSFIVRDYICSIVYPKQTEIQTDFYALLENMKHMLAMEQH